MTVSEYLQRKGLYYKEQKNASGIQAIMPCPKCGNRTSFAINLDTGAYQCFRANKCNFRGSFTDFQRFFNDTPQYLNNNFIRREHKYDIPNVSLPHPNEIIYDWFDKRKISRETVKHFKVGFSPDGKSLAFPFYKEGELVNVKYRLFTKKEFYKEKNCKSVLWNQDNITGETLYVTEGEADCMALYEYGIEGVSIPSGVDDMTFIEFDWDFLEKFKTIYLIMDNDKAGQSIIENFVMRLGEWRCRNVKLPYKDVNECLLQNLSKEEFLRYIDKAEEFNIEELKHADYFTDEIISHKNDFNKLHGTITSGASLTKLLKGWRMEELSVWTGMNNSGKSTYLSQEIIHLLKQGKKCCIGSFEMPPKKYLLWLCKQALDTEYPTDIEIDSLMNDFAENLFIINILGEINKERLFDIIEFGSKKYGINFYVIDSLMKINLTTDSRKILGEQKNFVASLKDVSIRFKCHIHLVAHPRKVDNDDQIIGKSDVAGTADITNLADNVFIMYRFSDEQKAEREKKGKEIFDSFLIIKKNREHGEIGQIGLMFNRATKKYYEKENESNRDPI